jgi:site-specific DNA-cytosine methylase
MQILKELEILIPPLTSEEFKQLERNILEEGIRDPLVTWNGILVDGHNRYRIAQEHNLEYKIIEMNFADIDEAKDWMDKNQIGRRNLSPDMMSYIRGRMYNRIKKVQGGTGANQHKEQRGQNDPSAKTAEIIAQQTGVGSRTIKRDEQYYNAVNKVAKQLETPAVQLIHKNITTKKDALKLAKIVDESPEIIDNVYERINNESLNDKNVARDIIFEFDRKEIQQIVIPKVCSYDSNMYYESAEQSDLRYGDKVFSLNDIKYNTVSTLSRFFHLETGIEFNLREYADVQTFPKNYKFVGNYGTIKKQIGNAVAPFMAKHIGEILKGKTIGDLFSGCGGFSCGLHQHGFTTIWAVEWDEFAAKSFKLNFPNTKVYQTSIKSLDPLQFEKVDVIIGGPPCQGFSSANHENKKVKPSERFADDPRNELYKEFVRFVKILQPNQFIMENVPEIQDVKDQIIKDFESIGYQVETNLLEGNQIGMKQNRKRFFFIGKKINNNG